jgi:hypothetical protein
MAGNGVVTLEILKIISILPNKSLYYLRQPGIQIKSPVVKDVSKRLSMIPLTTQCHFKTVSLRNSLFSILIYYNINFHSAYAIRISK